MHSTFLYKAINGRDGAWVMPILVNNRIYCHDLRGATSEIVCLDAGHLEPSELVVRHI